MTKKIIAVDVDNVVVDLSDEWVAYINNRLPVDDKITKRDVKHTYDFHEAVAGIMDKRVVHDFWKQQRLYDLAMPTEGSVEALRELSDDFSIVFVSHVEGHHAKSKFDFLCRYFPFMSGFMATREKEFVRCDMLIDDRVENFFHLPESVVPMLFHTSYTQEVPNAELLKRIKVMDGWGDVDFIKSCLK